MERLLDWARSGDNRHFLLRKVGTCNETRWRVAVWVKPEAEPSGLVGHGSSQDLEHAIHNAIKNWETAKPEHHRPNAFWYAPRRWCSEYAAEFAAVDEEHGRFLAELHAGNKWSDKEQQK
jgi:hypothetical protein